MKIFIGIDDTDNLDTRGTGFQARSLGFSLISAGLFDLKSITRHQLLVDKRIPFTSHNSSACLAGEALAGIDRIVDHCRTFLVRESAFDSDVGLCVARAEEVSPALIAYGRRAKAEVLTMDEAYSMIRGTGIFLEGFKNAKIGVIGSLAGAVLRAGGEDGRLLWTRNLRETTGVFSIRQFLEIVDIDRVVEKNLDGISQDAVIRITEWCRPVMAGGKITLIAEKVNENEPYEYQSASKDYIKGISG